MSDKNTVFQQKLTLNLRGSLLDLSSPKVMGILNITPDSFYDGGRNNNALNALKQTEKMLTEGADLIDVGAYSSRPNAEHISAETEQARLKPVIKELVKEFPEAFFSIDTFRNTVAEAAINEGAHIINDISAGEMDPEMFNTVARLKCPYILMHMRGTPQNMQHQTDYDDIFSTVFKYFSDKISLLKSHGVYDLVLDPGFGFAKKPVHSYELLAKLDQFGILGLPVLAGVSRKSMIYSVLETDARGALNGTTVANTIALLKGAAILRVHDVKEAAEAVKIVGKLNAY
ncbi:dihydropteroate synthase [Daejeonella oryzae]|uniref:dihydropteroate synthase n=1 Tax=Daejeonella oryzae TaxID=1122943 RepID=UPI0003F9ECBE|nr:dihydropteroate synthase [Daejeonella oryzae]